MKRLAILLLLAALGLGGCGELSSYTATAIEQKKQLSDTEAEVLRNAPCAMTIGAFIRRLDRDEQYAVLSLCGMTPEESIETLFQ